MCRCSLAPPPVPAPSPAAAAVTPLPACSCLHPTPGGIAGACGVVAGQPLDTVRVRQQAAGPPAAQQAGGSGGLALLRSIAAGEGVRQLFRGLTYPLLTAALQVPGGGMLSWEGWAQECELLATVLPCMP